MNLPGNNLSKNCSPLRSTARESGFTYLGLMVVTAIIGLALASTGEVWHLAVKREKERELLFIGDQFRRAINQYAQHTPGQSSRYPMNLDDLLKDPRYPQTERYLRKIYVDPITGDTDWGLIKGPDGGIFGVYSRSEEEPLKKTNFSSLDSIFEDKMKYSEWVFIGTAPRSAKAPVKGIVTTQPGGISPFGQATRK